MTVADCEHCSEGLTDPRCPVHGMGGELHAAEMERRAREIAGDAAPELLEWRELMRNYEAASARWKDYTSAGRAQADDARDALAAELEQTATEGGAFAFLMLTTRLVTVALAGVALASGAFPLAAVSAGVWLFALMLGRHLRRTRAQLNAAATQLRDARVA